MPHADGYNPAERVQITPALFVVDVLHLSFHEHERLFVVEKNAWAEDQLAAAEDFFGGWAAVEPLADG